MEQRRFYHSWIFCAMIVFLFFGSSPMTPAQDLRVAVAQIPVLAESPEKGAFIDFVKALDEVYTDGKIIINLYPWARSIQMVVDGLADFQLPMISDPKVDPNTLPYRFASTPMGTVCVVFYTNPKKTITKDMVLKAKGQKPFPYLIELTRGTEVFYDFPTEQSSELFTSFKKLEIGRIDGFLVAQEDGDIICRDLKLKNIKRELWDCKDDLMIISKGPKGDVVDKILTDCMKKLAQSGKLKEIRSKIHVPYIDWQPYLQK